MKKLGVKGHVSEWARVKVVERFVERVVVHFGKHLRGLRWAPVFYPAEVGGVAHFGAGGICTFKLQTVQYQQSRTKCSRLRGLLQCGQSGGAGIVLSSAA